MGGWVNALLASSFNPPTHPPTYPNQGRHNNRGSLLIQACYYNKYDMARFLVDKKGANVHAVTTSGKTGKGWTGRKASSCPL